MIRLEGLRKDHPHHTWGSTTAMEDTLDALEWCAEHQGHGSFGFTWLFSRDEKARTVLEPSITGEFWFTDERDHMMFTMRWAR